ncbi:hypothetical protein V3G39_13865 [Dermatophilaceae bacterium Sec6.4]
MAEDIAGGPGWISDGRTLRPVITDLVVFREHHLEDPLTAAIEQLWSGHPLEALHQLSTHDASPRVRALRGDCLRDLGRHAEALEVYRQLIKESEGGPREAVMRQHYGKALLSAGDPHHARQEFFQALHLRRLGSDDALIASSQQALQVADECCRP